jgi:hypothetical protein
MTPEWLHLPPYGWPAAANQLRINVGLFDLSANDGLDTLYNSNQ